MLKLRKNKKGFTLVELIVVIAIMAVLAGVVAGVTVSQLSKNTDKTNLSQAKGIADFVAGEIADDSSSVYVEGKLNEAQILKAIKTQYASVKFTLNDDNSIKNAPNKGEFAIKIVKKGKGDAAKVTSVEVLYKQKQTNGKTVGYEVSDDGVIKAKTPA